MKKIIITLLCCITISCTAQYKIYSPTRIYGYLWLNAYETLPVSAGNNVLAISNDTLWIDSDAGWTAVWPTTTSGVVAVTKGGTGFSSYTVGDMLMASSTTALSKLSDVALGSVLVSGGVGAVPIWSKVDLTSHITGVLPTANGGTGTNDGTLAGYVPESRTVNGHALTGNVSVTPADVGLGNVTDESKATMFTNAALTGTPTAPTAAPGTNTTQIASTAFVQTAMGSVTIGGTATDKRVAIGIGSNVIGSSDDFQFEEDVAGLMQTTGTLGTNKVHVQDGSTIISSVYGALTGKVETNTTGKVIITATDSVRVDAKMSVKDSLRLMYARGGSIPMLAVVNPGGEVDTGWLQPVARRGLVDPIWNVHKMLKDTGKNGEIRWIHINEKKDTVSTYGLPQGMDMFEALQYTAEMSLRLIARQDSLIMKQEAIITELKKEVTELKKIPQPTLY